MRAALRCDLVGKVKSMRRRESETMFCSMYLVLRQGKTREEAGDLDRPVVVAAQGEGDPATCGPLNLALISCRMYCCTVLLVGGMVLSCSVRGNLVYTYALERFTKACSTFKLSLHACIE